MTPPLPPEISAYVDGLRAELAPRDRIEKLMVEQIVWAAARLQLLLLDPRARDPIGDRDWNRAHAEAGRLFNQSLRALSQRQRSAPSNFSRPRAELAPVPVRPTAPAPAPAPASVRPTAPPPVPSSIPRPAPATPAHPSIPTIAVSPPPLPASPAPEPRPRRIDPAKALRAERARRRHPHPPAPPLAVNPPPRVAP